MCSIFLSAPVPTPFAALLAFASINQALQFFKMFTFKD
jgi:hypothetical protein